MGHIFNHVPSSANTQVQRFINVDGDRVQVISQRLAFNDLPTSRFNKSMFIDSLTYMVTVIQAISQWLALLSLSNSNKKILYKAIMVRGGKRIKTKLVKMMYLTCLLLGQISLDKLHIRETETC